MDKPRNILITGGCGFIGSNFIRFAYGAHPNWRIFNLDALTYAGNPENLQDIRAKNPSDDPGRGRYIFIKGDICGTQLVNKIFENYKFDYVINFAAESHVDRSFFDVSDFVRSNIEGARVLLDAARKYGVSRFVQISTDEIYGNVEDGHADEDYPLKPTNLYSASKAAADILVQAYMKSYNAPAIIIRGSNNYGPYQYPEKLIPVAVTSILEGKKIPIHGTGEHVRSWLHVEDFCRAVDTILQKAELHSIYNVSGEPKTNLEILRLAAKNLGKDLELHREHVNDRPAPDMRYAPSSLKLERELGWLRTHNIEESIEKVVAWYVNNQSWWQKIKQKKEFLNHYEKQSKGQWY